MKGLIFGVGVLLFAGIACAEENCSPSELGTCFGPFSNLHFHVAHEFDVADLKTMCGDWDLAKPCVEKFIGGACQGTLPDQIVSSMRTLVSVADYICTDAITEIIQEHDCFFDSHSKAKNCMEHLGAGVKDATNPQELLQSMATKGGCDRISRYEVCVLTVIRATCSAKASDVIRHVYGLINRELKNVLKCGKPILSQPEPAEPVDPLPPVEDMSCRGLAECMRPHEESTKVHRSERCRKLKEMERCLEKALKECKHSRHHIIEYLKRIREAERRDNCEHHPHMDLDAMTDEMTNHQHLDFGTKIAIGTGVGAFVVVLVTIVVAVCLVKRRRRRRRPQKLDKSQLVEN